MNTVLSWISTTGPISWPVLVTVSLTALSATSMAQPAGDRAGRAILPRGPQPGSHPGGLPKSQNVWAGVPLAKIANQNETRLALSRLDWVTLKRPGHVRLRIPGDETLSLRRLARGGFRATVRDSTGRVTAQKPTVERIELAGKTYLLVTGSMERRWYERPGTDGATMIVDPARGTYSLWTRFSEWPLPAYRAPNATEEPHQASEGDVSGPPEPGQYTPWPVFTRTVNLSIDPGRRR